MQQRRAAPADDLYGIPPLPSCAKRRRRQVIAERASSRLNLAQAIVVVPWTRLSHSTGNRTAETRFLRTAEPQAREDKLRLQPRWRTAGRQCQDRVSDPAIPETLRSQASCTHQTRTWPEARSQWTVRRGRRLVGTMSLARAQQEGRNARREQTDTRATARSCRTKGRLKASRILRLQAPVGRAGPLSLWSGHLPLDRRPRQSERPVTSDGSRPQNVWRGSSP
mmetsp:Transcript_11932/g.28400  ORF Transcript_11932/g.28400 Transcript_11932/m.28400 type:complete len:223 (-) Transcript_11932:1230-1898(-)